MDTCEMPSHHDKNFTSCVFQSHHVRGICLMYIIIQNYFIYTSWPSPPQLSTPLARSDTLHKSTTLDPPHKDRHITQINPKRTRHAQTLPCRPRLRRPGSRAASEPKPRFVSVHQPAFIASRETGETTCRRVIVSRRVVFRRRRRCYGGNFMGSVDRRGG